MREGSNSSLADRRTTKWTEIAQLLSGEAGVRRAAGPASGKMSEKESERERKEQPRSVADR